MSFAALVSIGGLAGELRGESSEELRWRLLLGFLDEYRFATDDQRCVLLAEEPVSTGDKRWDVMLAAVAEHLSFQDDRAAPVWVRGAGREWLGSVWWVVPLASSRPWSLAHSPAAFRRRGIFLHPDDLAVA
jgi:hypothetical protein